MTNAKISNIAIMVSLATTIVGGSAWLTSMHDLTAANHDDIVEVKTEYDSTKKRIYDRVNNQDTRLSRIEGKIDTIIILIREGK